MRNEIAITMENNSTAQLNRVIEHQNVKKYIFIHQIQRFNQIEIYP